MAERSFVDIIDDIRERDPRYRREAYVFVLGALERAMSHRPGRGHVSGQAVLAGAVELAREEYGPLALTVLREWGLGASADVGRVVFHLVEAGLLGREDQDRLEDFEGGIDIARELEPPGGA